ncbi:MAG TPA: hypothetical protein VFA77_13510, partial [Candidatus Eisenbacteria bacterium]|nr:hypothetical protein [Candidatus Eisenbacteria bacterium]
MSLINDALKRAKQAQQQASSSGASGPQLRPAEASLQKGRTLGLALPIFIVALIALGLFLAWGRFHETSK